MLPLCAPCSPGCPHWDRATPLPPPPFSLLLGTPGPMYQLLAQLLAHDNQMSLSRGPLSSQSPVFAFQLSRGTQVLARLGSTGPPG